MEKKILSTPALYISYFLKKNRIEYYDRMNEVRLKGNYEQWIKFFLEAVYESAKDAVETIDKLLNRMENSLQSLTLIFAYVCRRVPRMLMGFYKYQITARGMEQGITLQREETVK